MFVIEFLIIPMQNTRLSGSAKSIQPQIVPCFMGEVSVIACQRVVNKMGAKRRTFSGMFRLISPLELLAKG